MSVITPKGLRVARSYRQSIQGAADVAFRLLCPVRELEWLDGWDFRMIYSASGVVEEEAVFATTLPGEEETMWVVSRHDAALRRVEFVRVTPGSRVCVLRLLVTPVADNRCTVDVSYSYTATSAAGDLFIEGWTEEQFVAFMRFWERAMNHFLATGEKLRRAEG